MDPLPMALLGPKAEVVVAGFPVGQVVRHHAPSAAGADDVEDAVEDLAPRVLPRPSPRSHRAIGQKRADDLPFGIGQAAWILTHPELLQYLLGLVQIKNRRLVIFQTASKAIVAGEKRGRASLERRRLTLEWGDLLG